MQQIEDRLIKLKNEELVSVLNSIYSLAKGNEVNLEELPVNTKGIVKPYIKASGAKRVDLIEEFIDALDSIAADDEIVSLASDIEKYIKDMYYSEPFKYNEERLEDRLYDLDELDPDKKLANKLIELLANNGENDYKEVPALIIGIIRTYANLSDIKKLEFLNVINDFYDNIYEESITSIGADFKKRQIEEIFEKVKNLSAEGQREFYEDAYEEIVEIYGDIAKRERIANCEHEFGKWKDCSYDHYVDTRIDLQFCTVSVRKILYARKCKKCGFEERIEDRIPEEVKIERERKAKESEIKRLERRLKKLKEDN